MITRSKSVERIQEEIHKEGNTIQEDLIKRLQLGPENSEQKEVNSNSNGKSSNDIEDEFYIAPRKLDFYELQHLFLIERPWTIEHYRQFLKDFQKSQVKLSQIFF